MIQNRRRRNEKKNELLIAVSIFTGFTEGTKVLPSLHCRKKKCFQDISANGIFPFNYCPILPK
jgi:hypothetical protein